MGQYTSYWLYQKYETRGSQDPIPCYPNVYSVDGDGTMSLVVRNEDDTQCGYVPPVEPVYRWVNIPITQDYVCDDCNNVEYRWINMNINTDYYCEGTTKYYKQKKQQSSDGGQTWSDVVPAEYRKGDIAEESSEDCGYIPPTPQYRWVKTNDTTCIESPEPPTPTGKKLVATYNDDTTREVECNESSTLTSGETQPYYYQAEKMISAVIGDCVTTIGFGAFAECHILESVTIPNSVTSIGEGVFHHCERLTGITIPDSVTSIGDGAFWYCFSIQSITIPNSVTSIGEDAFIYCEGLTSVTVNASTPPTLGDDDVFYDTNNCPIYVPAASVNAYKTATNWSTYASRIRPIP